MHPTRRLRLEETMCRLGTGDPAAVWSLVEDFGDDLAKVARSIIAGAGRREVLTDDGRIEGIVVDIALHLFHDAGSWDPQGGALPWVWARKAIERIVYADLGHRAVEIDDLDRDRSAASVAAPSLVVEVDATLAVVAERDPAVAKLIEAIALVGSARDAAVHTEYRVQNAAGDPSPANTVADEFGLQPANVRQIDARMRRKLRRLAETDSTYSEIGDLRWLA
ncbi:MAG: hypothetical protein R2733_20175 [Acidimicrobiales bacterium]